MTLSTADTTKEPLNYFTSQRLGYRTDEEIESLPTNAIDVQPRRRAYQRMALFFAMVFVAILLDRILPIDLDDGVQTLDVFVIAMGILGVVLYFPLLYFAWRCLKEEHQLVVDITSLELERQEKYFPVQEEVPQRSVRLAILRGLPIFMVLLLFWEARLEHGFRVFDWILLSAVVLIYAGDLICLEWYRRKAMKSCKQQTSTLITPPWPRATRDLDSPPSPSRSPLINAQIA